MIFLDNAEVEQQLFPFTLTRKIADLRIGILTIREKWQLLVGDLHPGATIPSNLLPGLQVLEGLKSGADLFQNTGGMFLEYPWHIFQYNDQAIRDDFRILTDGRQSAALSNSNRVVSPADIFLEEGAKVEHCVLNASAGPVYIGKNAEIMEGSLIRGPFAMCEGAVLKMGSKVYGATTIGPYCIAGGEIKNSVMLGYSNKAHDGYLGDAVIGEWCNLGAGTSNSNLKNNARQVKIWNPVTNTSVSAGLKCGLLMGDYSRSAINTSFNTGTVTGVCCNIFGPGLTNTYIPSFSWGQGNMIKYELEKALRDIESWKQLKKQSLTQAEIKTLSHIFDTV